MIIGVGVDIEEVDKFKGVLPEFLTSTFTESEIAYCSTKKDPAESLAATFCAKEAAIKASSMKIPIKNIEVRRMPDKKIGIYIDSVLRKDMHCSISHTSRYAIAFLVISND